MVEQNKTRSRIMGSALALGAATSLIAIGCSNKAKETMPAPDESGYVLRVDSTGASATGKIVYKTYGIGNTEPATATVQIVSKKETSCESSVDIIMGGSPFGFGTMGYIRLSEDGLKKLNYEMAKTKDACFAGRIRK